MANLVDYVMELEMDSEIMGQALQVLEENSIDVRMSSKENGYHVEGCCKWDVDSCFFDEHMEENLAKLVENSNNSKVTCWAVYEDEDFVEKRIYKSKEKAKRECYPLTSFRENPRVTELVMEISNIPEEEAIEWLEEYYRDVNGWDEDEEDEEDEEYDEDEEEEDEEDEDE